MGGKNIGIPVLTRHYHILIYCEQQWKITPFFYQKKAVLLELFIGRYFKMIQEQSEWEKLSS